MAIVRVIEVLAESRESWEDATRVALQEASLTIRGIRSVYIKEFQTVVENNQIVAYRVNAKISFVLEDGLRHSTATEVERGDL